MASDAVPSVKVEPTEKECSVCHQLFSDPKLLPCGHLMCRDCVLSWIKTQKVAPCPLCGCPIADPTILGSGDQSFIDNLPTDLAMKELVDAEKILSSKQQCAVCEDVAASVFCLTCGDLLCSSCTKVHNKLTLGKHHVVEELASLTSEKLLSKRKEEPCSFHPDKVSEAFCNTHESNVCSLCASTDHRECQNVRSLKTELAEAKDSLKILIETLTAREAELDIRLRELDQNTEDVERKTQWLTAEIEDTCNRLESAVKACRRRLLELAWKACSDVKAAVNAKKAVLLPRKGKLSTHRRVVERTRIINSGSTVKKMMEVLLARVYDLEGLNATPQETIVPHVNLAVDPMVVVRVNMELSRLVYNYATLTFLRCGRDVVIRNNGLTAEKRALKSNKHSLVLAKDAMELNMLYEVRIDKLGVDPKHGMFPVGIVNSYPANLALPDNGRAFSPFWGPAVVLLGNVTDVYGTEVKSDFGKWLVNMPVGSRVGISVNENRYLLLYLNGQLMGAIAYVGPNPVYPLFNLTDKYIQITAMPPIKLTSTW